MMGKLMAWLLIAVLGAAWAYLFSLTSGTEQGLLIFVSLLAAIRTNGKCKCKETSQAVEG